MEVVLGTVPAGMVVAESEEVVDGPSAEAAMEEAVYEIPVVVVDEVLVVDAAGAD